MGFSRNLLAPALPLLARAGRRRIALLGNSIEGQATNYQNGVTPGTPFLSGNYSVWMNALSHQRVKLPKTSIFGYPGKTLGEFIDPVGTGTGLTGGLAAILALSPRPDLVVLGCATNNVVRSNGEQTLDFIINGGQIGGVSYPGYTQAITALLAAGIKVMVRPIGPRSDVTLTAAQAGVVRSVNRWLAEVARRDLGVYVPRYVRNLVDPTSTGFAAKAGVLYAYDNLHPNFAGSYWMGKDMAEIIAALYPRVDHLSVNSEVWSASAPNSNLLVGAGGSTPQFAGTGGAVANGATGTVPTGWTVSKAGADTNVTIACSVVPSIVDPAYNAIQLAYGGTYTPASPSGGSIDMTHFDRIIGNVQQANFAAGDVLEGFVGFEFDAGLAGISALSLQIRNGGNTSYNEPANPSLGGVIPAGESASGVLSTHEITVGSGDLASGWFFIPKVFRQGDTVAATACAGTVRFTRPFLGKLLPY